LNYIVDEFMRCIFYSLRKLPIVIFRLNTNIPIFDTELVA